MYERYIILFGMYFCCNDSCAKNRNECANPNEKCIWRVELRKGIVKKDHTLVRNAGTKLGEGME